MHTADALRLATVSALLLAACDPGGGLSVRMGDAGALTEVGDASPTHDAGSRGYPDGCIPRAYFEDDDGDGYGRAGAGRLACAPARHEVARGGDCDESSTAIHPEADEICGDRIDQDCDGVIDEDCACSPGTTRGCGASATAPCTMGTQQCVHGAWSACMGNVDPTAETCNATDDDCDGSIDEALSIPSWFVDTDRDGWGAGAAIAACAMPTGYVPRNGDCDDTDARIHPTAAEICDLRDDDCNGAVDDGVLDCGAE